MGTDGRGGSRLQKKSAYTVRNQDCALQWMVQGDLGGAPMVSATDKKSDLNIYRLIEASPVEAEMY